MTVTAALPHRRANEGRGGSLLSASTFAARPAVPFGIAGATGDDLLERRIDFAAVHRGF